MRTTKKIAIAQTVTDSIFCNLCGYECLDCDGKRPSDSWIEFKANNNLQDSSLWCGLIEAHVAGGYYSPNLKDGVEYSFSLCEKCLVELFEKFKIPVAKHQYD